MSATTVAAGEGFVPPTYPFDRLKPLEARASCLPGGLVDLSVGTPCDPPPPAVVAALGSSGAERGYPAGAGSPRLIDAARGWIERRFGIAVSRDAVAACVGTKELVAGVPHWLRLRRPERDTVLYPAVSYPTYAMGAVLARCRAIPVPARTDGTLALEQVSAADAARAVCLWVNSPANPTGRLDDLGAAALFGRAHGVPVLSDECYAEFTWNGPPRTILEHGVDGVLAVHSISKRSNCAGVRVGFYAGDPDLVGYLRELRRHAGLMVAGPAQLAGAVSLEDDEHVEQQRRRYGERIEAAAVMLEGIGVTVERPGGGFYLWVEAPRPGSSADAEAHPDEAPEWQFARRLAEEAGALVSPGEFYGPAGRGYVRIALVQPMERIALVAERLERARASGQARSAARPPAAR